MKTNYTQLIEKSGVSSVIGQTNNIDGKVSANSNIRNFCYRLVDFKFILLLFVSLSLVNANAQVKNYLFSSAASTYTAITGGTVLANTAAIATDANYSVTIPTFRFNNVDYTQIYVNNNGYITFGATAPTANNYSPISVATAFGGAVTGWSSVNLVASTVAGASAEVRWEQVGSDVVIQFKDLARTAAADRMNYQIRLTPGAAGVNGTIKIVYGIFTTTSTTTTAATAGVVGIRGASNTEFHTRAVYGTAPYNTWASSGGGGNNGATKVVAATDATVSVNSVRWTTTIFPASGLTYTWSPVSDGFYQSLPYTQNFDAATWTSSQATQDVPSSTGVTNWPASGHASWRSITASAANALWNGVTGRLAAPTTQAGAGSAQFNQYNCSSGSKGNLDFYLNFSTTGGKAATFYVRNPGTANVNDVLNVYLSTDGGLNFSLLQSYAAPINAWTQQTLNLGSSTSSKCILRFEGVSDYGSTGEDLAIDELNVSIPIPVCAATPSPSDAATGVSQTPTLSWASVATATGYDVYLGTTSGALTLVSTNQAGLTYAPATLSPTTQYYWRVVPVNTYGNRATGCTEWSFTTQGAVPSILCGTLAAFGNVCDGNVSNANSFTVSGINLVGNVEIGALSGYTYSLTAGGTYTSTLSLSPTSGTLASTLVYVKFSPTAAGSYNGNIVVSTSGATDQNVAASGTGIGLPALNPITGSTSLCIGATTTLGGNTPSFDITSFTTTGTSSFTPIVSGTAEVLVVAGGGAGGTNRGGGGGAGGVVYNNSVAVVAGTPISVTVGAGGVGSAVVGSATNGGNSVFGSITATGGGRGGNHATANNGANGGSGGGAGLSYTTNTFTGGTGVAGQGFAGGGSQSVGDASRNTGGGGGAGGVGVNPGTGTTNPPNGGVGISNSITGSAVFYGGGGGGANGNAFAEVFPTAGAGTGGNGGGGAGAAIGGNPTNGAANTGGGGGGGGSGGSSTTIGGNGGSGIVIVKAPNYYWSTSDASVATVDALTGVVTGVSAGTAIISYTKVVNGCPNTVNTTVTVNATDVIAAVSSVSGNLCLGASTDISVTQTGSNGNVFTFSWSMTSYTNSGLSGVTPATVGTPITVTPTAVGSYVYTINAASAGCNPTASVTVNVINPTAGVTATATATPSTICAGSPTSLNVNISRPTAVTLGAGGTTSIATAASFLPGGWGGAKTQYIIRASELTALGLTAGNITSIGFEPTTSGQTYQGFQLWVNTTANTTMTTTFLGLGTQVYLATGTDNGFTPVANTVNTLTFGTGAGSASSFNWDGTSNLVLTFSWSRVPATNTSTGSTMKVDATGFTCSAYDQTDNATPAAELATVTGDGTGTSRPRFIINGNTAPAPSAYSWSDGSTVVGSTNPLSQSPTSSSTYTATVSAGGCPVVSNAVAVTVNPIPAAPAANVATSTQCGAGAPAVSVTGTAGQMRWYDGNTVGATLLQTGGLTYTSPVTSTQTLYVGVNNGTCETAAADRTPLSVTVNAADALTASVSPIGNICLGSSIDLSVAQTGSAQSYTLTWTASPSAGSGIPTSTSGSLGSANTVTPTSAGTYTYTISGVDGLCSNIGTVNVTVINPNAGLSAVASATPTTVCAGGSISLNVNVPQNGTATIGTATTLTSATAQPTAFCNRWGGHRSQVIFTAAELTASGLTAGNISSMAYNITSLGDAAINSGFTVLIGNTSLSSFSATTFEATTGFTTCYPAANYTHTASGWQTINFSTPFNWNGTSNIIVDVSMNGANATNNSITYYTATTGNSVLYTTTSLTGTVTLSSTRLNVRFGGVVLQPAVSASWSDGATVVGTTNPLSQTPSANTSYTATTTLNGCPLVSNAVAVTYVPTPNAPTFSNNTVQCGTGIPTVTFAGANSQPSPNLNWYTAASGGTNVNPSAYTGAVTTTYYNNSFGTGLTANGVTGVVNGNASLTGSAMQITPNLASQQGGFRIPGTGIDVDAHEFSFKLLTTSGGADGFSFNFGDDVPSTSATAEAGAGTKLSVTYSIYATPGISVKYNGVSLGFYNTDLTWRGTNAQMLISINNDGQVTVSVNGTPVLSNIQLPAGYLSANKAAWSFNYLARTGAITSVHTIDDVIIKYASFAPATTFPTPISATTTWYVSENIGACESPRTPVTVTVNTPDVLTAAATVNNITCLGSSTALSVTKTGTANTYSPLTWSLTSYTGSGLSGPTTTSLGTPLTITPTAAGTYNFLITGVDGVCTATSNVSVTVSNPLAGLVATAAASPTTVCAGSSTNLSVTIPDAVATLGAGATTSAATAQSFFPGGWGGAKTQYIIRAAELTALGITAGNLTNLAFEPTNSGQTYQGFQLWLNTTSNNAMTTTFLPNGTQVYLATGVDNGFTPVANTLNTLAFGTGAGSASTFSWDGTSNLVVTFSWSTVPSSGTSASTTMKVDAPGFTCSAYEQSDNITPAAQLALGIADGTGTSRPRFIFITNTPQAPITYSWSNGATAVGTTNPLSVSPTANTSYTCTATIAGCPLVSSPVAITVTPTPTAPIATGSSQCGPAIPTAYMSTGNAQSSPAYTWYSAASGGTALNTMTTYYNNDFTTSLTANGVTGVLYSDANFNAGPGFVRLTTNNASMNGAFSLPAIGVNANAYQFGFALTTPAGGADGMSFNFGNDVDPAATTPTAEAGSGTKLSVTFDIYDAAGTPVTGQGIRVKYNGVELAYNSTDLAWIGTAFAPVLIDINSAGQISVTAGGVLVISNVQLPPAYLAANKSTWAFAYKARTGGVFGIHRIDDVLIKYLPIPNDTYPNIVSSTTTFYVSETVGTCESPRTPITVTVLSATPPPAPTVTSTPTINVGGTSTYTATGVTGGTISWYSSALGGSALATGPTFISPTQCTPGSNVTYYAADNDGTCVSNTRGSAITAVRPLITTDPANALICTAGGNVVLSGNVTGGSSIAWSPGTNLSSTTALVTTASPTTTTQYTFNANVTGCAAQSGTVNVGVIPSVAFTPTATPAALCEGETSVLASNLASSGFTSVCITPVTTLSTPPVGAVILATGGSLRTPISTPALPAGVTINSNTATDDNFWGNIPVGFTFNYFGVPVTNVFVGTNGTISLGATGSTQFNFTGGFPNVANPASTVALCARDLNVSSGTVSYWTEGIAPTRRFIVQFNGVSIFTGGGVNSVEGVFYETTGIVDIRVISATNGSATAGTNSSKKYIGLQDATRTIGATATNCSTTAANYWNGVDDQITSPQTWRFTPGANYTFQWSVAGSDVVGATSTSYTTPTLSTPGSVIYTCAATNPYTQCASKVPVTITVNAKPTAPISGGNVTACSNITPQTLSATPPAGCTIDWYAAASGGTVLASGSGTSTFSVTTAGTYYAESRNTTTGCSSPTRTAVIFTQNPAPAAPTVTSPIAFCENSIATALTATGTGLNTLNWYTVATGGTPSSTAPTPATTTATTLSYYVSQVDGGNSCESDRALIEVKIDATPAAPTTSAAGPYCENATATALSATADGLNTLNWYTVATGGTSSGTAITPATTPAGTTLYYVSQSAAYTLPTLTCESARASISVLVNPNITASVNNSATTTSLCTGGNIDFTATPTNGGATPSYQWQVNGSNVGTDSPTYTLTPELFSDNGGDAVYSGGTLSNGMNGGSGFGAWNITAGANSGTYVGDPAADGNSNTGMGSNSFGFYATGSNYVNALRTINGGMQVGDTLSFYWIFNWDANGGNKGFDFKNGGTTVFNINNGGYSGTITSTAGTVNTAYGTTPMFVTLIRTSSTQYAFSMTSRSGGATYTNTITNSTSIDGINFYIGNQNDGSGNRNMYVNNLVMKKYYQVLVNITPSAQTCLTSSAATPSNTIVLGYAPSTPSVSIVAGGTTTICPGSSLSFSIASSANLGSAPTYQWQVNGVDVSGETGSTFTSTALVDSDIVSLIATSSISGGCLTSTTATSNTVAVVVQAPTTFTTQPIDAAACLGATQVFSAAATGTGTISYQWYKSNTLITGNPTAITDALTLSGLVSGSAADYYVRATGTCGSANSDTITLTLNPSTVITTQPLAASLCAGLDTMYTVAATGFGAISYQWRKNGTAISGETNDTLVLTNVQSADAANYSVLVTAGCNSLASNAVGLTVNQLVDFATQPVSTTSVCAGATANLSASVTGAGTLTYQWQLEGVDIAGANSSSLAISNAATANDGIYRLIATSSLCGADTSSTSDVTVNPVTAISTQPIDVTLCNGSDALFNVVTAGIGTINYQWRYNGVNIPGETNDTLLVNNITNIANAGTYSVVVTGGTCSSGTINSTTVSLNVQSTTSIIADSQTATCIVKGGDWIHFYSNDGKLIVSINSNGNDLGNVTATSYVDASPIIAYACNTDVNPNYASAVLGRRWVITPENNLPAIIRLPFSNSEFTSLAAQSLLTANGNDDIFSMSEIQLNKYSGLYENGDWQDNCTAGAGTTMSISQTGNGDVTSGNGFVGTLLNTSYAEFSIPSFSEFWLMHSGAPSALPVDMTSFSSTCKDQNVEVNWSTASEQNSQSFVLETSRDLSNWITVSQVAAAGNSSQNIDYSIVDENAAAGVSYYRLIQIDLNGVEKIYGPISASCSDIENSMIVFPNPTKGNFTVEISSSENISNAQIQVTDLTGKVINERTTSILEGKTQFTFEGLDLQLGTYIINLNTGNGKINPVRVVVN